MAFPVIRQKIGFLYYYSQFTANFNGLFSSFFIKQGKEVKIILPQSWYVNSISTPGNTDTAVAGLVPDTNIKFGVESAEEDEQLHDMDSTATEVTCTPPTSIADVTGNIIISTLPLSPLIHLYWGHRYHGWCKILCMQFDFYILIKCNHSQIKNVYSFTLK